MKEALKLALEALETERDIYREHDEDGAPEYILEAITAIKVALAQPAQETDWVWVCNECGSPEFTSALSEADLEYLACAGCGVWVRRVKKESA